MLRNEQPNTLCFILLSSANSRSGQLSDIFLAIPSHEMFCIYCLLHAFLRNVNQIEATGSCLGFIDGLVPDYELQTCTLIKRNVYVYFPGSLTCASAKKLRPTFVREVKPAKAPKSWACVCPWGQTCASPKKWRPMFVREVKPAQALKSYGLCLSARPKLRKR
jgi:hypothetical protein